MNSRNAIKEELISLQSELPLAQSPAYAVPEGYFEGLATVVLAKVKEAEAEETSPLLASIPRQMPFAVPSTYFEDNLQNLPSAVTETVSPLLAQIGKELPYDVPAGYFDGLPQAVLTRIEEPKARVVPLFARTWMRVATAAAVVGALVIGALQLSNGAKETTGVARSDNQPARSTQVAQTRPAIRQEIKKVSTTELERFIENVSTARVPARKPAQTPVKTDAEELLRDLSVNEMESFLSAVPTPEDEFGTTN